MEPTLIIKSILCVYALCFLIVQRYPVNIRGMGCSSLYVMFFFSGASRV